MKLKNFLIVVKDIEKSKQFYRELFGLEMMLDSEGNMILTEGLVLQDEKIWREFLGKDIVPESNSCELYFEENDIEAFVEKLERLYPSIKYVNKLMEHSWGQKVVRFYDLDGNLIEVGTPMASKKKKVAFICVHNSCRSQIAEALGKHLASDVFESYSAGTETKPQINQDAVRIMKELYGIDMEQTQYSKLISDIPDPDVAISMGCNVGCPFIGRAFDDNWGLEDPTGKSDEEFKLIIAEIESNILRLKEDLAV